MTYPKTLACTFSSLILLVGCGGGGPVGGLEVELAPVTGKVTLDGQPMKYTTVTFAPASGGRSSTGETNDEGVYILDYSASFEGAEVGEHVVTLESGEGIEPEYPEGFDPDTASQAEIDKLYAEAAGPQVPQKYSSNGTESIKKTVESGSNEINIELTSD